MRGLNQPGYPIPLPAGRTAQEWINLLRAVIPDTDKLSAVRVWGRSRVDAGDLVILNEGMNPSQGDLVAVRLKRASQSSRTLLRRYSLQDGQICLRSEDPAIEPIIADARDVEIRGIVLCIVRDTTRPNGVDSMVWEAATTPVPLPIHAL